MVMVTRMLNNGNVGDVNNDDDDGDDDDVVIDDDEEDVDAQLSR